MFCSKGAEVYYVHTQSAVTKLSTSFTIHNVANIHKIAFPTYSRHAHSPEKQFLGQFVVTSWFKYTNKYMGMQIDTKSI